MTIISLFNLRAISNGVYQKANKRLHSVMVKQKRITIKKVLAYFSSAL